MNARILKNELLDNSSLYLSTFLLLFYDCQNFRHTDVSWWMIVEFKFLFSVRLCIYKLCTDNAVYCRRIISRVRHPPLRLESLIPCCKVLYAQAPLLAGVV